MTRRTRVQPRAPWWRTPSTIIAVALLAVAAGMALALLVGDDRGTASGSPTPTATVATATESPAGSPEPSATTSPTASGTTSASPVVSATPEPSATPVVEAPDGILPPGSVARVAVDALRVRAEPSTGGELLDTLARGDLVGIGLPYVQDWGPIEADGFAWYPIAPLTVDELPSPPADPLEVAGQGGWVAAGDGTDPFLELLEPRCLVGEPDLALLEALAPWERLACYGNRSITIEGIFGCGGCGGFRPGTFEPAWLAHPLDLGFISIEPNDRIGPMTLRFPPDGADPPEGGSIITVTGHFDDPRAAECRVEPGDPPEARDERTGQLGCREAFVVETYEITGVDEDFPSG